MKQSIFIFILALFAITNLYIPNTFTAAPKDPKKQAEEWENWRKKMKELWKERPARPEREPAQRQCHGHSCRPHMGMHPGRGHGHGHAFGHGHGHAFGRHHAFVQRRRSKEELKKDLQSLAGDISKINKFIEETPGIKELFNDPDIKALLKEILEKKKAGGAKI